MNKGMEIRKRKLEKKRDKRNSIKEGQENVCRFVDIKWEMIERINGKYRHTGTRQGRGLQVRNRVYLTDGHYKLINSKSVRITKIYGEVPEWATDELIKRYTEGQKP